MTKDNFSSREFSAVIGKLREFCHNEGMLEACVQQRKSILAACEDPATISTFTSAGTVWPLPQTGQMQLEVELLTQPDTPGFFTLSTSYRDEPEPIPGRHCRIFPLFEFELKGNMNKLIDFEQRLLRYLGFKGAFPQLHWEHVAKGLGVADDIGAAEEAQMEEHWGPVIFLTHFPERSSPFWNMMQNRYSSNLYNKVDVILCGQETSGTPERETDPAVMRKQFHTISNGEYAATLYDKFGRARVDAELDEYLQLPFIPRCGGGIGITRLMRAMRLQGLL